MGFLDNSSITVDAILTKRGREILAQGGNLGITKFALSDEEVDYTLYDVTHPNGTDSYGTVIENMSLLEATPNRKNFNSHLINQSQAGTQLKGLQAAYADLTHGDNITLTPETEGGANELYTFIIENTTVVYFQSGQSQQQKTASTVTIIAGSIQSAASTTVTITGNESGLSKVITVGVQKDVASSTPPDQGSSGGGSTAFITTVLPGTYG
jgi:hypothetical protein